MSPEDKANRAVAKALSLASSSEHEEIRKRPHAFISGALEFELVEAYRRLDLAERRLAEAQRTVEALHEFHGDPADVVDELLPPQHVVVRELDMTFTVRDRADRVVFAGTEAELLAWARAQSEAA